MGRNLRLEHLQFFDVRMREHNLVESCDSLPNEDDYLFKVSRRRGLAPVVVHLTDAYFYGVADYVSKPKELRRGSFICMGMPHANYDVDLIERAKRDGIGLGHIGKLMGALNLKNVWEYETREEKEKRMRQRGSL